MKKNFLSTLIVFCFIFLPAIVLYQSCRKQDVKTAHTHEWGISDAKEIYAKVKTDLQNKFGSEYGAIDPHWEQSKVTSISPQNAAMYTPLAYNNETGSYLQLITMKDKGKLRSLITELKPDKDYFTKRGAGDYYQKLNGKLLFYTVTGNFIKGFTMKKGLSQAKYYPGEELDKPSILNRSSGSGVQNRVTTDDPCEGNWGNFGCQELASVVVKATPSSGGGEIVYISLPSNLYYSTPAGGTYGGYSWTPIQAPTSADFIDLSLSYERPCPSSFRFKNLTSTMREALVWGLRFELYAFPSNTLIASTTFGLTIDIPSDLVYNAEYTYTRLMAIFGSRLSGSDLQLTGPDSEGNKHLIISQAAQTMIAVEAVHDTNIVMKESGLIQELEVSTSYFKQEYKEYLITFLSSYVPGIRAQILNSNTSGTTPYRSESLFGC